MKALCLAIILALSMGCGQWRDTARQTVRAVHAGGKASRQVLQMVLTLTAQVCILQKRKVADCPALKEQIALAKKAKPYLKALQQGAAGASKLLGAK